MPKFRPGDKVKYTGQFSNTDQSLKGARYIVDHVIEDRVYYRKGGWDPEYYLELVYCPTGFEKEVRDYIDAELGLS